jgi:CubicO group peptidase (beta-lactamase class C family)
MARIFHGGGCSLQVPETCPIVTLDAVIDSAIEDEKIVGCVVLVARDGEIAYERAAGFADREAHEPVERDTLFRLASFTKLAVSCVALALVEKGTIALDDPVTKWLPDFQPALPDGRTPTITLRHLLTHTAGLDYAFNEGESGPYQQARVSDGNDQPGLTIEENLRRIVSVPLLFDPGTQWNYSVAHDVVGEMVARAANELLPQLVSRIVTEPLEMRDTAFHVVDPSRLAVPYAPAQPRPVRMNAQVQLVNAPGKRLVFSPARVFDATSFPSGGVGLVGTAGDFVKLLEALRTGGAPILKRESAQTITTNQISDIPSPGRPDGWRFGFGTAALTGEAAAATCLSAESWEWGGVYGNRYWVEPQRRISAVVLTNTAVSGMTGKFPDGLRAAARSL